MTQPETIWVSRRSHEHTYHTEKCQIVEKGSKHVKRTDAAVIKWYLQDRSLCEYCNGGIERHVHSGEMLSTKLEKLDPSEVEL